MPEPELLDERIISGRGVLKIPTASLKARYYIMYVDVIRNPKNAYINKEWNPPQGMFARITYRRDSYVVDEDMIKYERFSKYYVNDIAGQALRAIKCAYEGILISFDRQNAALGLIPLPYTNLIQDFESLALGWDEVLFSCYSNTALQVRFYGLNYDVCNAGNDQSNYPPPPPPPLPKVPNNAPIGDISEPYDPGTQDDGNTSPFPGDEIPQPPLEPPGEECVKYRVVVRHGQNYGDPFIEREAIVYGEVLGARIVNSGAANAIQINCRGWAIPSLDAGCQAQGWLTIFVSDSVAIAPDPEIVIFEEYVP